MFTVIYKISIKDFPCVEHFRENFSRLIFMKPYAVKKLPLDLRTDYVISIAVT